MWVDYYPNGIFSDRVAVEAMAIADNRLLLAKLIGVQQSVRRVWAHLVGGRSQRSATPTNLTVVNGDQRLTLYVDYGVHYKVLGDDFGAKLSRKKRSAEDEKALRTIYLVRESLLPLQRAQLIGFDDTAIAPHFASTFRTFCKVPIEPEWIPELWRQGREEGLIKLIGRASEETRTDWGSLSWGVSLFDASWYYTDWHKKVVQPLCLRLQQGGGREKLV